MADNQRDHGKEPLTEREREVLQMLAREIVREAGLDRDPEKEAAEQSRREFIEGGREHWKAQVDFFKHMAVISAASVVGVGAASEILPADKGWPGPEFLALSPFLFLASAVVCLFSLYAASRRLTQFSWGTVASQEEAGRRLTSSFDTPRTLTFVLFAMGLTALIVGLELPGRWG